MPLFISPRVREKLKTKHNVTEAQVVQCFANRCGGDLLDRRPQHQTNPPTRWFISETDYGIKLKVCFVYDPTTKLVEIKSAFPPNEDEIAIYKKRFG
ncbi:ADP-ribosyl-(dinitrogen reductase) hydrolase [Rubrivivax albus]|uniref:ADP-ribosyl-(Dinitrogen reductase) hydrolase n=1 Tax=Rubrivivax albus TaxID=2499835 RepID=A0A437JS02_9BURK|nr:ADP-ribosyl-(dinitrogen reductase) hydrolase [Rubrivivax albus]RVT49659.1 ADP-ribosyl-(dinitrogen reductase) hydrolase [Rubrivivax albus]